MRGDRRKLFHTGAIADNSVSSSTFSIDDFDGSIGGGLTSVGWSAMAAEVNERPFARGKRCWRFRGAIAGIRMGSCRRWRRDVKRATRFIPFDEDQGKYIACSDVEQMPRSTGVS